MKAHFFDKSLDGLFEHVGGAEAFRRIARRFHDKVELDPALRGLFPKNMSALDERLALYLAERTGGGACYTETRGKTSLVCRHAHIAIGTAEGDRWLEHMAASLVEEGVSADAASTLVSNLTELAATLADPFVLLYSVPLDALRKRLSAEPSLVCADEHGRNLLCAAAIAWDVPRMRLLLECGAEVKTQDGAGHNALYRAANGGGREEDGRAAVELLIRHGADVNQATGVGGMTPLHMAARRGTTGIAEALLDAGADVEAKDKAGETPLRRAVNCGREGIVELLLARGADPRSKDRHGRTTLDAARTEGLRQLLSVPLR